MILQVAALVSGGKDSALALYHARQMGYHVKFLVTMIPQRNDSWMFHFPNIHLTNLFAEASCIPLVTQETSGLKEREVKDLKRILSRIETLKRDPRPPGCEKLTGQERYRLRQGRYRIVYSVQDDALTVWVVKVGHRKDVYR